MINDKRFTIFSLPTFGGRHSVAVVIDTENHECHVIDSLNQHYPEAQRQINSAISLGTLPGYKMIRPSSPVVQQSDGWSCGIHSAANMVGIINGDIDLKNNTGISPRNTNEVNELLGIFSKAYADISVKRANELENPRLNARQKKTLRFALEAIDATGLDDKIKSDIDVLISALREELPPGISDEELLRQRSFTAFLTEFGAKKPNNMLVPLLNTADFAQTLPATMQDNLEEKEIIIQQYITPLLSTPPVLGDVNTERVTEAEVKPEVKPEVKAAYPNIEPVVASSSTPVVAEVFNFDTALARFVTPISDLTRQKNVERAIKYFHDVTNGSPAMFNEIACSHIASHSKPGQLAGALKDLKSTEEPRFKEIVILENPMRFWIEPTPEIDDAPIILATNEVSSSPSSSLGSTPDLSQEGIKSTAAKEEVLPAVENKQSLAEAHKKLQAIDFDRYLDVIEKKKDKYKNSDRPDYISAVTAAGTLHDALTLAKSNFLQSKEPMNRAWPEFKTACIAAIDNSRTVLEQHRGWKQVLADICSAIVSVVSLGTVNFATKSGMFGIFPTKTDTAEKLDELADRLDKGPKNGM
jgi:hypothetical protein